jgi:ribosomal protein L7/L12
MTNLLLFSVLALLAFGTWMAISGPKNPRSAKIEPPTPPEGGDANIGGAKPGAHNLPALKTELKQALTYGGISEGVRIYVMRTGAPVSDATRIVTEFHNGGTLTVWQKKTPYVAPTKEADGTAKPGVADYVRRGDHAGAVARYRELTNGDEAQAEKAVKLLEAEIEREPPAEIPPGTEDNPRELTSGEKTDIVKMLLDGKRIEAVDRVRRLTGLKIEEASKLVASIAELVHKSE